MAEGWLSCHPPSQAVTQPLKEPLRGNGENQDLMAHSLMSSSPHQGANQKPRALSTEGSAVFESHGTFSFSASVSQQGLEKVFARQ